MTSSFCPQPFPEFFRILDPLREVVEEYNPVCDMPQGFPASGEAAPTAPKDEPSPSLEENSVLPQNREKLKIGWKTGDGSIPEDFSSSDSEDVSSSRGEKGLKVSRGQ